MSLLYRLLQGSSKVRRRWALILAGRPDAGPSVRPSLSAALQRRRDRHAHQSRATDGLLNQARPFGSLDELIEVGQGIWTAWTDVHAEIKRREIVGQDATRRHLREKAELRVAGAGKRVDGSLSYRRERLGHGWESHQHGRPQVRFPTVPE